MRRIYVMATEAGHQDCATSVSKVGNQGGAERSTERQTRGNIRTKTKDLEWPKSSEAFCSGQSCSVSSGCMFLQKFSTVQQSDT